LANDVTQSDQIPVEHLPVRVRNLLDKQRKEFEQISEEVEFFNFFIIKFLGQQSFRPNKTRS
jgi:hypothetical protein